MGMWEPERKRQQEIVWEEVVYLQTTKLGQLLVVWKPLDKTYSTSQNDSDFF